jgi:basic membrane protein A and related proteins
VNTIHQPGRRHRAIVLIAAAGLLPAAGVAAATTDTTQPPADTTVSEETTTGTAAAAEPVNLDTNGDGQVVIGVATPGPRDDGGYYQAMVDGITQLSEENGFAEPIIVDNIAAADAEAELRNLARQNVDIIAVGAGELSDPLPALSEEFADIIWYCNCGAGLADAPGVAQARDDSSQISYSAGYATGLLLQDPDRNPSGSTSVAFLGCCDLDFEKEAFLAFEAGLQAVDDTFTATYIPTGDFNDVAGATEAYNQALSDGVGAVYPFLGGSQEAVAGLANEDGIITMAPGPADACEREDPHYDIAVVFDAGVYVTESMKAIVAGELHEGEAKMFLVGEFDPVGAYLCDATPEQEEALQAVRDQIAAGDFDELFGQIKGEAYGGAAPVKTG